MYNITDNATAGTKASMAVVEFEGQGFLPSDLAKFEAEFGIPNQPVRNVTGPPETTHTAGVEASLDIQYIVASGVGVPVDFYLHAGNAFDLLGWAAFVQNETNPPLVWSMSYGEGVNGGNGGTIPVQQTHALDLEMVKLGLRGISVLIASGDSGVYNRIPFENGECYGSCGGAFSRCL
jgi:subtilase family serine protease